MVTKISKLKNFGIFRDFIWKSELPEFKKFNLIYGWNRSGKTTLSRVFESCEKKCVFDGEKFKQYPEDGEFELKTDSGTVKETDVGNNTLPVKVFNQDFVEENISFDPSDSCKPIVYVGEEDIESKKELDKFRTNKASLGKSYEDSKKDRTAKEDIKSVFLKGLGVSVSNIVFDKTYNRTKAESKINEIGIDNFPDKVLSDDDKQKYEEISRGKNVTEQSLLENAKFEFSLDGKDITNFEQVFSAVTSLLQKKVVAETIDRLKDDPDINAWVKQGYDIHKTKQEKEKCLFCQNSIGENLFDSLSKHFSKDYENLQSTINLLIGEIENLKQPKIESVNDDLFPDLKDAYKAKALELNKKIEELGGWIDSTVSKLKEKHDNPLATISNPTVPEEYFESIDAIINELNTIISNNNAKVKNHSTEVKTAREKLELHTIAVALSEQDYKKIEKELLDAQNTEKSAQAAVESNNKEISKLEQKASNVGKAIGEINKHLEDFFGKEEIKLELDGDSKGYVIKRDGKSASNLSEGEKTAIAFSYFIVKVGEKDFKIKDGIIFIDDPISSFDSNFIYHCFSMINNQFKEAGQLFISTHNFQLFNLIKDWFIRNNNYRKSEGKDEHCGFYMVENYFESDQRKAKLVELDKTLRDYKSEYHFLFSLLFKFKDSEPDYADFYTIGNVARRFFDIFADFKIPDSRDQKQKLETIVKELNEGGEKVTNIESGKVYKLINEFSHNSDPTSAIEHKDKSESKEAIAILLKIVEESDPKHYKILKSNMPVKEVSSSTSGLPKPTEIRVPA